MEPKPKNKYKINKKNIPVMATINITVTVLWFRSFLSTVNTSIHDIEQRRLPFLSSMHPFSLVLLAK